MARSFETAEEALNVLLEMNAVKSLTPSHEVLSKRIANLLVDHVAFLASNGGTWSRPAKRARLAKVVLGPRYKTTTAFNVIRATDAVSVGKCRIALRDMWMGGQQLGTVDEGWGKDNLDFHEVLALSHETGILELPEDEFTGALGGSRQHPYINAKGRRAVGSLLDVMEANLAENPDGLFLADLPREFPHEVGFEGMISAFNIPEDIRAKIV